MRRKLSREEFEAVKEGNIDAFECLFNVYYDIVRCFVQKIIKSESYAKDITHNVFLILWEHRNSLKSVESLDSYLFTVARNEAFQHLRSKKIHTRYVNYTQYNSTLSDAEVHSIIDSEELKLIITEILDQLPEQKRDIFILSRVKGQSNEEIAQTFDISPKTVSNNISEVLKIIRAAIQQHIA